jgi:hypothetical protein
MFGMQGVLYASEQIEKLPNVGHPALTRPITDELQRPAASSAPSPGRDRPATKVVNFKSHFDLIAKLWNLWQRFVGPGSAGGRA